MRSIERESHRRVRVRFWMGPCMLASIAVYLNSTLSLEPELVEVGPRTIQIGLTSCGADYSTLMWLTGLVG